MTDIFTFSDNLTDKMKTGIMEVFITKVLGGGGERKRGQGGGEEEEEGRREEGRRRGGRVRTEERTTYHYKATHSES